ncbi:hypothetical protein [Acinetobacter sp. Marseille-Q1618]|uniref:hypothetical protein n=1 Tax=Acinetobacter sp. Marseille-Q1618 TaxID=2697502 RepID=UPI00156F5497|nr:hypothetical protein [Acinetobacter sp. Marseille-Q1618]
MKKLILICGLLTFMIRGNCYPLDTSIPLQVKNIDIIKMMEDGNRISEINANNAIEREKNRIYKEGQGNAEVMLELAKKSKLASKIVPYFQEQAYQQQMYELNRLKLQVEIEKIKQGEQLNTIKSPPPPMNTN